MRFEGALDVDSAVQGSIEVIERHHETIAGVLDLAAVMIAQGVAGQGIVDPQ